jgi:serine/threonine protein kinase
MFGPYIPVRRIGAGGMGEVWAATGPDGHEVAVKVLPDATVADEAARARFAREITAAKRVRHPRVQAVLASSLEVEPDAEHPWLATELVEGPTLAQRVAADGPVRGPELHALATGLAEALAAVHAAGVVHRDVSPANVVLGADGPVLVDFGIARFAEATTLTLTGTVVGTAGWLAPELLRDQAVTAAADVWSWAAVLAFAATGRPPADGPRAEVVLRKVLDGDLDLRGLPDWLDAVVRRSLVADPAQRPAAAELFSPGLTRPISATEVQPAAGTAVLPPSESEPDPARGWVRWAVRAAVLVAAAALGLVAPLLAMVLVVAVAMMVAIGLKLWAEERADERPLVLNPGTIVLAGAVAVVAALAEVIGLLLALLAFVGLVVVFFALGGDLG